ncbi:LacI family transcriptional regulator [Victivallis vadensis]|uniref:LacI family transcriptional regulator n=1 Tax=Victivallis vadensis TaxID=172901 RepID=A0A848AW57_9BACT|nr:LacI family DNA-binding transcriptional regulator [Victivallis vadensis]NMD86327.1 LacI family transcriptional regulator [Victivallis vadensis]
MSTETGRRPITLKMISEKAGCSISSVSTVLNNSRGNSVVGDKTRRHILAIANELGYRPNFASRSLKTHRSRTVGVYVQPQLWRSLGNNYERQIFKGIEEAAFERNYDILVLNLSSRALPQVCEARLGEGRIDGLLLLHADREAEWIDRLCDASDCVVAVDCCFDSNRLSRILFDNDAAIRLAVSHLAQLGHRRIGFAGVCTRDALEEAPDREAPFRAATAEFGLDRAPELIFNIDNCHPPIPPEGQRCQLEGIQALHYFRSLPEPPTAVVAYNSLAGLSLMREALATGLRVPQDLSIIGVDDHELIHFFQPMLTVIDHPLQEMGRAGAQLLIDLIEDRETSPAVRVFAPALLPGSSCRSLP